MRNFKKSLRILKNSVTFFIKLTEFFLSVLPIFKKKFRSAVTLKVLEALPKLFLVNRLWNINKPPFRT